MVTQIDVSIIMPVYKVEKYVEKAIKSILGQTLQNFEFIIVDDGTPDQSGVICDKYASEDSRIHVIHKENEGAPSARNLAINMAQGKYLYFIDSDDWAESEMLEEMYLLAEKNQAQMVIAGFYIDTYFSSNRYITTNYIPKEMIYTSKENFRKDAYKLFDNNMLYSPWNKLYLTSYIKENNLYFPQMIWDDFPFNLNAIRNIERVAVTSKQYYHFLRARSESETAKYVPEMYKKREDEHGWMLELYRYWNLRDNFSKEMIARRYIDRLIGCFENLTNPNCVLSKKEKKVQIENMLKNKRVMNCIKIAKPKSMYAKILYFPIKLKNKLLIQIQSKVISYIKINNIRLFANLKARR